MRNKIPIFTYSGLQQPTSNDNLVGTIELKDDFLTLIANNMKNATLILCPTINISNEKIIEFTIVFKHKHPNPISNT